MYALYVNECIGITKVLLWNPYGKFSLELYGIIRTVNRMLYLLHMKIKMTFNQFQT